jgi:hypothetical protein
MAACRSTTDWGDAALETALGEGREEALDGVEPGGRGRREVECPARMLFVVPQLCRSRTSLLRLSATRIRIYPMGPSGLRPMLAIRRSTGDRIIP